MKFFILSILFVFTILNGIHNFPEPIKATATIDGMGHFRLKDYTIDEKGCLVFHDFIGVLNRTCAAYKLIPAVEYQKQQINEINILQG